MGFTLISPFSRIISTKMFRIVILGVIFVCAQSQSSVILNRQKLLYEPPLDYNYIADENIVEKYVTQPVDHFNHQDNRTFQMRYLQNDAHLKSGGPIFIFIGGEWKVGPGHIAPGQHIYDLAKEFNGLIIYTEHRFYGETWPFTTVSTENLAYLSVDQALADLANFVVQITSDKELNATGGVIVVGRSYSATMAAWFRQKYPHLVNGAWASSGPLFAKLNYVEYMETVGRSIRRIGGQKCYDKVENGFKAVGQLIESGDIVKLSKQFGICDGFDTNNKSDDYTFASGLKDIFSGLVQTHDSGNIEGYCKRLNDSTNELETMGLIFRESYGTTNGGCVRMDYAHEVERMRQTDTAFARQARPWFYQTCSEFGWYQSTESKDQPFGTNSPLQFEVTLCKDAFGDVFADVASQRNMNHTNVIHGGFSPAVTHVYFTQGSLDPWHPMGILGDLNEYAPGVVIPDIAHCKDMLSINYAHDSPELINSKVTIRNLVKKWLKY